MWPFKKRIDPTSVRLASHASDITVLYQRWFQLETQIARLDKRVADLEKILKSRNMCITIVERE